MKEYKELLKDGRWQIRKTEIMRRDNYTCQKCGARAIDGAFLNVHHVKYRKSAKPWEYEDYELVTLCEDCHKAIHDKKDHYIKTTINKDTGLNIGDFVFFNHGDYDDYGIVYNIDSGIANAVFVDDGSGINSIWFGEISISRDGLLRISGYKIGTLDDCDEYSYMFFKPLINFLVRVNEDEPLDDYDFYTIGDLDVSKELLQLSHCSCDVLSSNPRIKEIYMAWL